MINPNFQPSEIEERLTGFLLDRFEEVEISNLEPLAGGNEAYLYKFNASGIPDVTGSLVLRLFPHYYSVQKAEWESMIHNLMSRQGVPVPKVYAYTTDTTIMGGTFMVMDFVEGRAVDPGVDIGILGITGKTHARLHGVDGSKVSEEIVNMGNTRKSHSLMGRWEWVLGRGERYPELKEILEWVTENMPEYEGLESVVHGDFHPMNLLVKEGNITGVLDWSGFIVGDPMIDLGWTTALWIATATHEISKEEFDAALQLYIDGYESVRRIDWENMDYYIAFRLAMALVEGKDGQEVWTTPEFVNNIKTKLKEITGITVKV